MEFPVKSKMSVFLSLSLLVGCASSLERKTSRYSLEVLERLKPGISDRNQVEQAFGVPDRKIAVDADGSREEFWLYFDGEDRLPPRISIAFSPSAGKVESLSWGVREGELMENLVEVKRRFPSMRLTQKQLPWTNPHAAPIEDLYSDEKAGFSAICHQFSGQVEFISWSDPSARKVASSSSTERKIDWTP
jgi:hypothetical protein